MRILGLVALCSLPLMGGCADTLRDVAQEPNMTPVGAGLNPRMVPIVSTPPPKVVYRGDKSLWQDASADLFKDRRALNVGDVMTVKISIKDKAELDNETNRSRDGKIDAGIVADYSVGVPLKQTRGVDFNASVNNKSETKGKGEINRRESIELLVAAVVTEIMPNGNLVISGSQEVRVNYEIRVLQVSGIVRPRDISADSSVSYEKIAEARIAYGGRGRLNEVQQPGWGQQLVDKIYPF
ncbi:MAG: flagellar basal body L-ring protein FlgH [Hyphomicrobiaceae bacterium]|jgi:flagellar L-ring protein FlgH|nr:flagellar basal body L-ring protein FlgH [Hyphomicrobiaceae bacterium]